MGEIVRQMLIKRRWLVALLVSLLAVFGGGALESESCEYEGGEPKVAVVSGHAVRRPGVARACRARRVVSRALGARHVERSPARNFVTRAPRLGEVVPIRC